MYSSLYIAIQRHLATATAAGDTVLCFSIPKASSTPLEVVSSSSRQPPVSITMHWLCRGAADLVFRVLIAICQ